MKNTVKKNSTAKKLLPAFGMLMVSASMLATSTYAWFSLSKDVTVGGMQINATSEGGLLVINDTLQDTDANWKTSVSASYGIGNKPATLLPTSTENAATWYYATSTDFDNADAHQTAQGAYTTLAPALTGNPADGIGYSEGYSTGFYLLNNFWIKSSGAEITSNRLDIQSVSVTGNSDNVNLDKSLRVAIVMYAAGSNTVASTWIYNPLNGDASYYVANGNSQFTCNPTPVYGTADTYSNTTITSIPASTTLKESAIKASVYLYFEGEDQNCKSSNLTTLDNLAVTVKFGLHTAGNASGASANPSGGNETPAAPQAVTTTGNKTTLAAVQIPAGATSIKVDGNDCVDAAAAAAAIEAINDELDTHTLTYTPAE